MHLGTRYPAGPGCQPGHAHVHTRTRVPVWIACDPAPPTFPALRWGPFRLPARLWGSDHSQQGRLRCRVETQTLKAQETLCSARAERHLAAGTRSYSPEKRQGRALTPRVGSGWRWTGPRLRAWGGETLSPAEGSRSWRCRETRSGDKVSSEPPGESAAQRMGLGWARRRRIEMPNSLGKCQPNRPAGRKQPRLLVSPYQARPSRG